MTVPMPVEIDDVTMAFPARALEFMPAMEDIPPEFHLDGPGNEWVEFQTSWFSYGLSKQSSLTTRTIDPDADPEDETAKRYDPAMVFRQLSAIQGSFAPKHEHKVAAVAYLASCWIRQLFYARPDTPLEEHTVIGDASLEEWLEALAPAEQAEEQR